MAEGAFVGAFVAVGAGAVLPPLQALPAPLYCACLVALRWHVVVGR